jgi:hypothetical protein
MVRFLVMLVVLSVGAGQALAEATVKVASSNVTMNSAPISGAVTAYTGATIRAGETGYATIYYKNGCSEVVEARQTRIVQDDPVCDQGAWYGPDKKAALVLGGFSAGLFGMAIYALADDDDTGMSP